MQKYIDAEKFLQDNAYFADRDFVNPKYDDTLRDLIDGAPAADVEPKQRWIPVTERFPKPVSAQNRRKTKPVLLYSPKGGFYVGWYFGEDYRGQHIFTNRTSKDSLQYITTKVTHWTTLPESPEGEDDAVSCN